MLAIARNIRIILDLDGFTWLPQSHKIRGSRAAWAGLKQHSKYRVFKNYKDKIYEFIRPEDLVGHDDPAANAAPDEPQGINPDQPQNQAVAAPPKRKRGRPLRSKTHVRTRSQDADNEEAGLPAPSGDGDNDVESQPPDERDLSLTQLPQQLLQASLLPPHLQQNVEKNSNRKLQRRICEQIAKDKVDGKWLKTAGHLKATDIFRNNLTLADQYLETEDKGERKQFLKVHLRNNHFESSKELYEDEEGDA